ncbi:MATE family efflux transporter [Candidatus Poribacteria bacterium]|nr:MAG: MATE family efflux transporter [Candidatus Poribacteria bacterium]
MHTSENVNKQIVNLTIPNIISNFSIPLLGAVDTALMGRLESEHYLGAVGIGGILFSFIYWGFGFLRMATTGLTAQAFGKKNLQECGRLLLRAVYIGITASLLLLIFQRQLADVSFSLIDASPEVEHLARVYFHIRIYAAPATLCLHAFHGVFLGLQNAHYPMLLTIVVNLVNIILNVVFVKLLGMKVEGVALATAIAQYIGLFVAVLLFSRYYRGILRAWRFREVLALSKLKRFLSISGDIFIRTLCLVFSHAYFTAKSAALSDTFLAINTILMQYINLMSYAIDGFAFAAESMIGKYKGARDMQNLKRTTRQIFLWAFLFSGVIMLVFVGLGEQMLHLFTNQMPLIDGAKPYLIWIIIASVVNVAAYIWDGIFLGATASKALRDSAIASTLIYLSAVYLLMPYGNHGLWTALTILLVARGVSLTILAPKYLFKPDNLR